MTSADLVRTMADRLRDTKLVVVANRQPYVHEKQVTERTGFRRWVLRQGDKVRINWKQPASGLVTAAPDGPLHLVGGVESTPVGVEQIASREHAEHLARRLPRHDRQPADPFGDHVIRGLS